MNTGVVSMRYAKALLAYAIAEKKEDEVYKEVDTFASQYFNTPDLRRAVTNPVLDAETKMKLLKGAAGGNPCKELERFFRLVLQRRREEFLQFMAWSYIDLYHEAKNILVGKLITAVPSAQLVTHLEELASKKTQKHVELQPIVKPSIIGGFVFELDGCLLDASIANQLKRVKQQFIAKNRTIV